MTFFLSKKLYLLLSSHVAFPTLSPLLFLYWSVRLVSGGTERAKITRFFLVSDLRVEESIFQHGCGIWRCEVE